MSVHELEGGPSVFSEVVDAVRETGNLTTATVADITGVNARQVRNWSAGSSRPSAESRDRLLELLYIIEELGRVYTPEGVEVWLHARNRMLDHQRPVDLLLDGQFDTVRREVQRLANGVAT